MKSHLNDKTISVRVDYTYYIKKFKGYNHRFSKFLVHDEENFAVSGDKVIIKKCKPLTT